MSSNRNIANECRRKNGLIARPARAEDFLGCLRRGGPYSSTAKLSQTATRKKENGKTGAATDSRDVYNPPTRFH